MTLTFRHIGKGSYKCIKCKKFYPTKTGLIYIDFNNEERHELENYVNNSDLILWSVE